MNNRFFSQAEQMFQPMAEIMALNAKTLESLTEKQTSLVSEVWTDGMNYVRDLSGQRDAESLYNTQRRYWENLNHKFSAAAQDSYAVLTEAQGRMTELVQESFGAADLSSMAQTMSDAGQQAMDTARTAGEQAQQAAQDTVQAEAKAAQKAQPQAASASKATGKPSASSNKKS